MIAPPARRRFAGPLLLAALAAASAGCVTRTVRTPVFHDDYTEVLLRSQKRGGRVIEKGFEHPATIAPVRLAHILSRIDLRSGSGKERVAAVPLDTLFTIAEGVAKGLAEADSSQEVVVQSIRRSKRWGVFDRKYLTSFLCYVRGDRLYVHFSRSDWEIPRQREDNLPETHVGEHPLEFRLMVDTAMTLVDHQSVAIDWRDDVFRRPTRTRITPGGRVVRRTILMESQEELDDAEPAPTLPEGLTPAKLRELADLEEERQGGRVTEAEYRRRRNAILGSASAPAE